jgi:hypothetical protein
MLQVWLLLLGVCGEGCVWCWQGASHSIKPVTECEVVAAHMMLLKRLTCQALLLAMLGWSPLLPPLVQQGRHCLLL